jgi:hypothetical protein
LSSVASATASPPRERLREGIAQLRVRRTRLWVEGLVLLWLLWVYDATTNLAPLRLHEALANARGVLHAEQLLGIDPERTLDHWLAGHHTLATIVAEYYDNAHFVVTLAVLVWLWWRRADIYRPFRNLLVVVNLIGFVVFWRYPVAPPRMLPGFTDVVSSTHAFANFHGGALASQANQLAAMPSLHMAWAAWCALAVWTLSARRWVRALAVAYPCLTAVAVMATGNHFALDLIAGLVALLAAALLLRAGALLLRTARTRRARRGIAATAPAAALRAARVWGRHTARHTVSQVVPARLRERARGGAPAPAYRLSQSCYEVQDPVD